MFVKYMHLERLGTEEVDGIEIGKVYVFPKLDGTNASVWLSDDGDYVCSGSRNRVLSPDNDNAGFCKWAQGNQDLFEFLCRNPNLTLYGEWLVPHSLKTYRDDAWRRFYVFDVFNRATGEHLHYDEWSGLLMPTNIDFLAPIAILKNPGVDDLVKCLDKNVFLIKDGEGVGEGIVIKNYDFVNKFGRVVWAKLITNAFKEKHHKEMGAPEIGGMLIEEKIVEEFVSQHLVDKVYAKIVNDHGGWSSKYIPMLLNITFYDLVQEEIWEILKKHNNPRICFKTLKNFTFAKVKQLKSEVF